MTIYVILGHFLGYLVTWFAVIGPGLEFHDTSRAKICSRSDRFTVRGPSLRDFLVGSSRLLKEKRGKIVPGPISFELGARVKGGQVSL